LCRQLATLAAYFNDFAALIALPGEANRWIKGLIPAQRPDAAKTRQRRNRPNNYSLIWQACMGTVFYTRVNQGPS